jgi:hypothetical protein
MKATINIVDFTAIEFGRYFHLGNILTSRQSQRFKIAFIGASQGSVLFN